MPAVDHHADPEDLFADTRMSFGDHIEVLRLHLVRALVGFGIGLFVSLFFGQFVVRFIAAPVEKELSAFYNKRAARIAQRLESGDAKEEELNTDKEVPFRVNRRELARILGLKEPAGEAGSEDDWVSLPLRIPPLQFTLATQEAIRLVGRPPLLATMNIMEAFMVYFKVSMVCGLIISSPWVFWQLWSFIAAGLYPHEKRYVNVYLPVSLGLFLAGIALCEWKVIPTAISVMLEFNDWLNLEPDLRLNEWLSFAILLPLVFGVSFQTPLVMMFLAKFGIVPVDTFRRKRRIAYFVLIVLTVIIIPTVDAFTCLLLWVPLCALYELGIWMSRFATRSHGLDMDVPEPEEMVEV
jgi:sec-independent protein translocase protein TatC